LPGDDVRDNTFRDGTRTNGNVIENGTIS